MHDCGIVLAHELIKQNERYFLSPDTKERTDAGISLLKAGIINKLVLSGGCGYKYEGSTLSQHMKDYALRKGVNPQDIIEEQLSRDTIGQLVFVKFGIIIPRDWRKFLIITHSWHGQRTQAEADFVFGNGYSLSYSLIGSQPRSEKGERKSLEQFTRTFKGVCPGSEDVLKRLLRQHSFYNRERDFFIEKLREMSFQNSGQGQKS
jgi:uncharacterized SAM-binding protein YcdF (DUF218 family)